MKKIILTVVLGIALLLPLFTASSCAKPDNIAKVIIWQDEVLASTWNLLSVTSLTTYVDGNLVASQAANVYFKSAPSCSSNGGMKFDINLKKNTTGKINVIVKGDDGEEYSNFFLDITSKDCTISEIL
jgi:hypothetical protein